MELVLGKLDLKRSTYYYLRSHPRKDAYADVRPLIRDIFSRTPNGMGYRRVRMALRHEQGLAISGKTVLRLMREERCRCKIRRKRYSSYAGEVGKVAGNVLNRQFKANVPMERLATDVTEFAVAGGKAYLSPVMDMFNNEIVAWSVSPHPNMAQIREMMEGLRGLELGPSPLLHSASRDGSTSTGGSGLSWRTWKSRRACRARAPAWTTRAWGGFFGHLKDEFSRGQYFESYDEFKTRLDDYIVYWNTQRRQLVLDEMTPAEYRGHRIGAA